MPVKYDQVTREDFQIALIKSEGPERVVWEGSELTETSAWTAREENTSLFPSPVISLVHMEIGTPGNNFIYKLKKRLQNCLHKKMKMYKFINSSMQK